ncbi:MAG: tetratricopeptide repeat protein, partial [Bacteroidetes bacterium]|nr:tetratricopeptide repeat protein [Bacteroidota bacterium]
MPLLQEEFDPAVKADRFAQMGMAYYYQYVHMDSVFHYSNRSYEIALAHGLPKKQGRAIFQVGLAYSFLGNYEEAISSYKQSIALLEPFNLDEQIGSAYNNIGGTYFEMANYEKAIENYEQALEVAVTMKDTISIGIDNMNIGEAYYKMGMLLPAREKLEAALAILKLTNYDPPTGHLFYARILDALGNTQLAEQESLKSVKIAKEKGNLKYISEASKLLSMLYAKNEDFEKAYMFQEQFTVYSDSIMKAREANEIEKLQLNFQLKEQKDAVASLSLKNKYVTIIYVLVGIGLLLLTVL